MENTEPDLFSNVPALQFNGPVLHTSNFKAAFTINGEEFLIFIHSNNHIGAFSFSPAHMKRVLLLLQREIGNYEKHFGNIDTELPQNTPSETSTQGIGFRDHVDYSSKEERDSDQSTLQNIYKPV